MVYGIQNPFTGQFCKPPTGSHWRFAKSRMKGFLEGWGSEYEETDIKDGKSPALLIKGFSITNLENPLQDPAIQKSSKKAYEILEKGPWPKIIFSHGGKGKPQQKRYLSDMKEGHIPITYWGKDSEISQSVGRGHGFETAKPLKLFQKIIQLWCPPNGLVFDPFGGSGTTGHAVLQLNKETGANRTDQKEHEPLGGGFKFTALDKQINTQAILQMERAELIDTIIASRIDKYQQKYQGLQLLKNENCRYLIAKNSQQEGFFLIWDGPNKNVNFTKEVYQEVVQEAQKHNLKTPYHVYARLYLCQVDTKLQQEVGKGKISKFVKETVEEKLNENEDKLVQEYREYSKGRELKEIHLCLVISNDRQNSASPLITTIPITSLKEGDKVFSFQVFIKLKKDSVILVDQIQTIDRDKFKDKITEAQEKLLEEFQEKAALKIVEKYENYLRQPIIIKKGEEETPVPFIQILDALTGSGKTCQVIMLAEFQANCLLENEPLVLFATVGTFNQKDKEAGNRQIYQCKLDEQNQSTWESLKNRGQRSIFIVYDEGHNLSDQQTDLLLELKPEVFLMASATIKFPQKLAEQFNELKKESVPTNEVVEAGLVKKVIQLASYENPREETISSLIEDLKKIEKQLHNNLPNQRPKAIYVCRTNVLEFDPSLQDNIQQNFTERKAPPILI
ncbi:4623_t:CDS:2 [Ambispora leptoticha]|uniref:4623_t:CDS:1 n=1 Tax=Ambispora leptoticha TaxID=144679 RepID=A0A9N9CZK6_9GLOM|nr:4623_t:CDS:2 [Ambispora leptoticha]